VLGPCRPAVLPSTTGRRGEARRLVMADESWEDSAAMEFGSDECTLCRNSNPGSCTAGA
jgi:hypothetical protein